MTSSWDDMVAVWREDVKRWGCRILKVLDVEVCEKKSCWGDGVVVLWLGCNVWD